MMSVLHNPHTGRTEIERKAAEERAERRRRLSGNPARAQDQATVAPAAAADPIASIVDAVRFDEAELLVDEDWVNRQKRLHQVPTEKPIWFSIGEEIEPDVRRVRIEDIQRAVSTRYNVTKGDLLSSRRTANIVRPRQIAMYLAKTITLRSLPEIGRRFGGRDHTTVLHAVRKFDALIAKDPNVAEEIDRLANLVKEMA